jgi:hypothetical protein
LYSFLLSIIIMSGEDQEGPTKTRNNFGDLTSLAAMLTLNKHAKLIVEDLFAVLDNTIFAATNTVALVEDMPKYVAEIAILKVQIAHMLTLMTRVKDRLDDPKAEELLQENALLGNGATPPTARMGAGLLSAAKESVNIVTEIANLFKVEYKVTQGGSIAISNFALRAAIVKEMKRKRNSAGSPLFKWKVLMPDMIEDLLTSEILEKPSTSEILNRYKEILKVRDEIATKAPFEVDDALKTAATACIAQCQKFCNTLTTVADGQTRSVLAEVVRYEMRVGSRAGTGVSHTLFATCVASGGNQITRNGLFCCYCPISFKGGTSVAYALATVDGTILLSDSSVEISNINSK